MSDDVGSKAARGAVIKLLGGVPMNLLGFALTLLCARVLAPQAYGVYSLALAIYGFSDLLTNPAVLTYLIRKTGCPDRTIDIAWTFSALRGVALSLSFFLLAPLLSGAFDGGPEVTRMLRIMSVGFVGMGLQNLHVTRFHHALNFAKVVLAESAGNAVGTLGTIGLLLVTRDPVALAIGTAANVWLTTLASWVFAPRAARPRWDLGEVKEIWAFTRFLLLNAVIIHALLNLDDLMVAKLAGTAALGLYAFSYRLVNSTVLFVIRPLGETLLPALAKLLGEPKRFTEASITAISAFAAISWMLCSGAWVYADDLLSVIGSGKAWNDAAPIFRALLPFVLIRAINQSMGAMIIAAGKPKVLTVVSGTQLLCLVPLLWLGFELRGFLGITVAITVLNAGAMLALVFIAPRFVSTPRRDIFAMILLPAPAAAAAAVAAWYAGMALSTPLGRVGVGIPTALVVFLLLWELGCRTRWGLWRRATSLLGLGRRVVARQAAA